MSQQTPSIDLDPRQAPGHAAKRTRLSRKAKLIRSGLIFLVVLSVILGSLFAYGLDLYHRIHKVTIGGLAPTVSDQPINILLVGSNSRAGLKPGEAKYFGSASEVGGARSDVTMIAHLDPKTGQVTLLSIPRDTFVPIPNTHIANRVDDALNVSPEQLVKTIEQDFGIPIQHFVELNFDTFQQVVQALGGIKMYFPMPVRDAYSGLNITTPGCHLLNGFQTLEVVRARHLYYYSNGTWTEDPLGDLSRIRRDHEFLKVLASQVKQNGLTNPLTMRAILSNIVGYLEVDGTFSLGSLLGLGLQFQHVNPNSVTTAQLPIEFVNNYYYKGAAYGDVVYPVEPQDSQVINTFLGRTTPNIASSKILVSVLNASGIPGQAGQLAAELKADGFQIGTIGNDTITSQPAETIIRYKAGYLAEAEVLQSELSGSVIMAQTYTKSGTPLELVAGSQLTVAPPPAALASSNTPLLSSTSPTTPPGTMQQTAATAPVAPITVPATLSHTPLQPWDPRACP